MNKNRMPRAIPIFLTAAISSCIVLGAMVSSGGTALAADPLTVTKIIQKDTNGTPDSNDDKTIEMTTGYEAYRVALDGKGNAYVTDPEMNIVYKYNNNGHLVNAVNKVNAPLGVGTGDGNIYVGGYRNGYNTVFVFSENWEPRGNVAISGSFYNEIITKTIQGDVYVFVVDSASNSIKVFKNGAPSGAFGPYVEYYNSEVLNGATYSYTRHRLVFPNGIEIDSATGEAYVTFREYVDRLLTAGCSDGTCISDESAYQAYPNATSAYKYWHPVASRQIAGVVNLSTRALARKIEVVGYELSGSASGTGTDLRGVALDNSGRLYIATNNSGIKVYDASSGAALSVSGGFASGIYNDLAFDPDTNRLFATKRDAVRNIGVVDVYGIDAYTTPANTAPSAPALLEPSGSAYAASVRPALKIANASDNEADPLMYGYEIKDKDGVIVADDSGISEGANGTTSMSVNTALMENASYSWRAQSFDGNAATWSGEAEFCVNEKNDNPTAPAVVAPVSTPEKVAVASPFGSSLTWNSSTDPDCYDTVSYVIEVSNDRGFSATLQSNSTSVRLSDFKGLSNGASYDWRVKAVDNNGGESAYGAGSFTYKTTVVKFESDQPGTKVYIDGNYGYLGTLVGNAPREVEGITPGSHFVAFVKAGYEPVYKIVNVADPLADDSALTVTARAEEWDKASRIKPAASGTALFRTTGNSAPFVVDYNNDGLKDVIGGDIDGNVYLYLSEEQLQEDDSKKVVLVAKGAIQNINVGSKAVPFVVDFDNDGKKDLLVGSGDGHIYLYLNTGDDASPVFSSAVTIKDSAGSDIKVLQNSAPVIVDYNNDGKKDLIVGGSEGTLRYCVNIGADGSPEFSPTYVSINVDGDGLSVGANSKAFFTDWNSDGKKDLVVGNGAGAAHLYLNVGSDDSPDFRSITALQQWIKDKKRERGNREFIPYLGYGQDLGDLAGGSGDTSLFVVDMDGSPARDIIVGNGAGGVVAYVTE